MSFIIDTDTSVWSLVPFMVLLGLGLGFNFQPVILAVQNAVRPNEMGVATSSVTFFRQMGGTIGVAAFLSILFTTLPTYIGDAFRAAGLSQIAGSINLDSVLGDTSQISSAPAQVVHAFKDGFSNAIGLVFLVAAAVVAIGFFVMLFLPEVPLSDKSGIQALQEDSEQSGTTVSPDDVAEQVTHSVGASAPTSTAPPAGTADHPGP
jgi:hypothetical protein